MKNVTRITFFILVWLILIAFPAMGKEQTQPRNSSSQQNQEFPEIFGPYTGDPVFAAIFNGDLRSLPQLKDEIAPIAPFLEAPGQDRQSLGGNPADSETITQRRIGVGEMPNPIANFAGLNFTQFGSGWPPDTNGDVGPNHYIQAVNTSVGIFDKATGQRLVALTYNNFFPAGSGTACDLHNRGDPIVLYDPYVERWVVSDFAWIDSNNGPFYECIAVSQSADPVAGGWYYYAMRADTGNFVGYLNDYPKLGVWRDGWYLTARMFQRVAPGTGFGVRVWALDRTAMIAGGTLNEVHFDTCLNAECDSLLPSNVRGNLPPSGAPNYVMASVAPNRLWLWKFHVDWTAPLSSTLSSPQEIPVASFSSPADIPQKNTSTLLDSLGFRLMMQLQYRRIGNQESLWLNHTIANNGVAGLRWYELRDPFGTPAIFQQGTYQPDSHHRWVASLAADKEGNMAIGYSVSSSAMFPSIRYSGRLNGEIPGQLTQGETELIQGTGSQIGVSRWGDYSAMSVDPTDDCTFWYTNEYLLATGSDWQTRIGAFKFPSCGQPKAYIQGAVRNAVTQAPVPGVTVTFVSSSQTLSVLTDASGVYTATLLADTFSITAQALPPGYPNSNSVAGVVATSGNVTSQDILLAPTPNLVVGSETIVDLVPGGNGNGFPEPGEQEIELWEGITNNGAITATQVVARLESQTPGVTVLNASSAFPDIPANGTGQNLTPFVFAIDPAIPCGADIDFRKVMTSAQSVNVELFSLNASIPQPSTEIFSNDVEAGAAGWTTGGTSNTWEIVTQEFHSANHSWTDSPAGNYANGTNSYLRTPAYNLSGKRHIKIQGWAKYSLEAGYDYVYLDYSLNGGGTWSNDAGALLVFNGIQTSWQQFQVQAPMLDNQVSIALRFRLVSDGGVTMDGIYMDDVEMVYEPFTCEFLSLPPNPPGLVAPPDQAWVNSPVTFEWQAASVGVPADGFVLHVDGLPYTYTASTASAVLDLNPGKHIWYVQAFNANGYSPLSATREVNVWFRLLLPYNLRD